MQLQTNRLIIREFTWEDWPAVHAYASDPEVVTYMIWGPNREEETKVYVQETLAQTTRHPRLNYDLAVIEKESSRLVGGCSLNVSGSNAEFGYCFHRSSWGRGYATEVSRELLSFGFEQLQLHRIYATCRPQNIGSMRVLEKLGMRREGHLREHFWAKGAWQDSYLYAILATEFKVAQQSISQT
ncbi:MAG: GNAT family N-acetyltransferase [Clostridia bacterium]